MLEGFYELHPEDVRQDRPPAGRKFDEMWDYRTAGGALLLGLKGTGIIAHGRSDAKAIEQAVKVAYQFAFTRFRKGRGRNRPKSNKMNAVSLPHPNGKVAQAKAPARFLSGRVRRGIIEETSIYLHRGALRRRCFSLY